jgi:pSer/pThr/pTyr-binding forkhead associated (FHA) protein
MTDHQAHEDSTRVRPPSASVRKIPERYSASIVIVGGYAEGMEYPVTGEYTVIGRDKDADIAVKDPLVSRRHVAIIYQEEEFTLKDLGSTNGTIMNGNVIEVASLRHRDKFRIGDTTIQFILQDTGEGRVYEIAE